MKKTIITCGLCAVLFAATGFGTGVIYQKAKNQVSNTLLTNQNRRFSPNNMMGNRPTTGEILEADDKSLTLKLTDGSSKIILLSQNTSVVETQSASKSALLKGKQILVLGNSNSDGSITAQSIQLNPQNNVRRFTNQ